MKISEMTNKQAKKCLIRLSGPFSNICADEAALKRLEELFTAEGNLLKNISQLIPEFVTFALKDHEADLNEIIGALLMVPTKEVDDLNFIQTVQTLQDSYDEILKGFFTRTAAAHRPSADASA